MAPRRLLGLIGSLAALTLAGCFRDLPTYPGLHAISGRVRLVGYLTAADGSFLGTRTVDDASGVPVELLYGETVLARTTTQAGAFRFPGLRPGGYRVRSVVFGPLSAKSTDLIVADRDVDTPTPLLLASAGDLFPAPNPLGVDGTWFHYLVPDSETIQVMVRDMAGGVVRRIADGEAPAGELVSHWDGLGAGHVPVTGSLFWVTFESGSDQRAQLLFK